MYSWQCHVCACSNKATSVRCEHCGFPGQATGKEITDARQKYHGTTPSSAVPKDNSLRSLQVLFAPLPLWRKSIAMTALFVATSAGLVAKASLSIESVLLAFAVLLVAMLVFGLAMSSTIEPQQ